MSLRVIEPVAVPLLPHLEDVQVITVPAVQDLDDIVQIAQRGGHRQQHTPPDRRPEAGERDLQLGNLILVGGWPALQRGPAGYRPLTELQQARRDRHAPGPVQRRDIGGRSYLRRDGQPKRRRCRRDVRPA